MAAETYSLERIATPTGVMLMVTDPHHRLRALDWEDREPRMLRLLRLHYGEDGFRLREMPAGSRRRSTHAARALRAYFDGEFGAIVGLPTASNGTAFQRAVWERLRQIPIGHTITYARLAAQVGRPAAARAVGFANGSNPIAIVVPCHRVIGADGTLTGYGGGLARKRWLLAHESACPDIAT